MLKSSIFFIVLLIVSANSSAYSGNAFTLNSPQLKSIDDTSSKNLTGTDALKAGTANTKESLWKKQFKEKMPEWTGDRLIVLKNGQWLALLFIIFLALVAQKISRHYIFMISVSILKRHKLLYDETKQRSRSLTYGLMALSAVWIVSINMIELDIQILLLLRRVGYILFTVATVLSAHNFVDNITLYFAKKAKESENTFDDILVPLINKTLKTFVIAVGIIFIGDSLTLDMKGILAGLGIGGFAFALAAKDSISNIFGSLTVLLDRPFVIGDWVVIDGKIEGTVEEVGLRTTRIRTFYDSLISLPNGKLVHAHIDNYGRRKYRRYSTKIGIQYDTPPEKVEAFCEGIRHLIINHKSTRKDYFHVYLNGLGESSLEILLYVFWQVPDWSSELNEKHRLLVDVLRLGEKLGVEFAFPTQTLHMYQEKADSETFNKSDYVPLSDGKNLAESISGNSITAAEHRSGMFISGAENLRR